MADSTTKNCLAISGGVGGAKLALGLSHCLPPAKLCVVANTGDDFTHLGFKICPDLDTVLYTLADLNNKELGWGQQGESWNFLSALKSMGGETWFQLGDRDLATHCIRTQMLGSGASLTEATRHLCEVLGVNVDLCPMTDDQVATIVHCEKEDSEGDEKTIEPMAFQHYFVRDRCQPTVTGFSFEGMDSARPSDKFIAALESKNLGSILICPSNPFVSVDPVLKLPGILEAMKKSVLLAAPTGRAAQRMGEVIGREAKTIHRLLEWKGGEFKMNEEFKLKMDFLIVDECSMLDISLTASLLKAVPENCQVLFIGDPDQLPSVGAGNVLKDIISSEAVPCFRLTQVFRQAKESLIIKYAHQINRGETPYIDSPFKTPTVWKNGADCLFIDSDEATQEQLGFITRVKRHFDWHTEELEKLTSYKLESESSPFEFRVEEAIKSAYEVEFVVPDKFKHVNLEQVQQSDVQVDALKSVVKKIHPWSSLHYGLSAVDSVVKLYLDWIPKYHGDGTEIQILTPMTRGSLGSGNLNRVIQAQANPPSEFKHQLKMGERIFREGDRVIHRRNNYDLNVFNGDIGKIIDINNEELTAVVSFYPDNREVNYKKEDIMELDLAYAITIHKSQGSEFKTVIIPILTQHFKMLYRNLIYTGLTRAKDLAVFVGTRRALSMAIRQQDVSQRQTALEELLK